MDTVTLRRFRSGDKSAVSDVICTTLIISNRKDYSPGFIEKNIRSHSPEVIAARAKEAHFYVAMDGETIIGCGGITGYWGSTEESYLIENDRMAKVAFRLSPAYQGNRFMTEALARVAIFCFEETELQRLWADVHTQNIASYKTLEKVDFKREGLIREGKMVNIYCDYYLYGMT